MYDTVIYSGLVFLILRLVTFLCPIVDGFTYYLTSGTNEDVKL